MSCFCKECVICDERVARGYDFICSSYSNESFPLTELEMKAFEDSNSARRTEINLGGILRKLTWVGYCWILLSKVYKNSDWQKGYHDPVLMDAYVPEACGPMRIAGDL